MQLRSFAMGDAFNRMTYLPGLSKDGKTLPPEEESYPTYWGVWADGGGYANGQTVGNGAIGIDYRIKPHWLLGAYGQVYGARRLSGQGGLYTSFWEKGFYGSLAGAAGPDLYSTYGQVGYAWNWCRLLTGPVYALQYDNVRDSSFGFGVGQLLQNRIGWWLAYPTGPFVPQLQIMYQNSTLDEDASRRNAIWVGTGLSWGVSDRISLYGWYDFEGNSNYQVSQWSLGLRLGF